MARQLELYSLSSLEKGRIREPKPDPTALSPFLGLESLIAHSLNPRDLQEATQTNLQSNGQMKAPSRNPLLSRRSSRPFQDSALVERLIRNRNQIPVSSRIIRNQDS